ncbi:FKBP-type peptidyl-prolyl cis-trans isomerase [Capnocytophaga canimorsus]|uniref:FKBP-type peptidyl-prolyl cis-trans isomerase n=1 Tax=Capnocytophaga canimorsus TaxID=28188 RepID=UPI001EDD79AC|nr:FKBP-type peptidyl-prolyl cis-trans isomerase [Capnocytophaga canimorsus]GJQ04887.1 hypothetical protein CAPN009_13020 [Capnocytophaga canimorsus]
MIKRFFLSVVSASILLSVSCKKDDDTPTLKPPRDVTEVATENDASIVKYLKSHFYNYEAFQNPSSDFDYNVIIDTLAGTNANKTALFDQVTTLTLHVTDAQGKKVAHKMYYLPVQEGNGQKATVADSVFVAYKGFLLNGTVFDQNQNLSRSNWMDLIGNILNQRVSGGSIIGFREGVAQMKASADAPTVNDDGTFNVPNTYGIGLIFLPSGLAYFSQPSGRIPAYAPIAFEIKLIKTKQADHDKDGIPSIKEIEYESFGGIKFTDCDQNQIPDYLDPKKCK